MDKIITMKMMMMMIMHILEKFFREQKEKEDFPAHYEDSITLIPKSENDIKGNKNYYSFLS